MDRFHENNIYKHILIHYANNLPISLQVHNCYIQIIALEFSLYLISNKYEDDVDFNFSNLQFGNIAVLLNVHITIK